MKASLYIRTTKSGVNLLLRVRHGTVDKTKKIATLDLDCFNQEVIMPMVGHPNYEDLLSDLSVLKSKMNSLAFSKFNDVSLAMNYLLEAIGNNKKVIVSSSYVDYFKKLIAQLEKKGKDGNASIYSNVLIQFEKYITDIDIKDIDSDFFIKYRQYLEDLDTNLSINTIKKYLATHRAVYNRAISSGICEDVKPFANLFKGLTVRARRHKNRYLDKTMLKTMRDHVPTSIRNERAIDLSLLQYYMCGADLADVYYMQWSKISRDRYYFERRKLGEKGYEIDIKLFPQALLIIDKYKTDKKNDYVFPWAKGWAQYKTFSSNRMII